MKTRPIVSRAPTRVNHLVPRRRSRAKVPFVLLETLEDRCLLAPTPQIVKDINTRGTLPSNPVLIGALNGDVIFTADDANGNRVLWESDGTAVGTVIINKTPLFQPAPYNGELYPVHPADVSGVLYFAADDGAHGEELWRTDGTIPGTHIVADLNPGSGGSYPQFLTNSNGHLMFGALGATWVLNPGDQTPTKVSSVTIARQPDNPYRYAHGVDAYVYAQSVVTAGTTAFFVGKDSSGYGLWRSDGTVSGTYEILPLPEGAGPVTGIGTELTAVGGTLYFVRGSDIWQSDGTAQNTHVLPFALFSNGGGKITGLTAMNGILYFGQNDYNPGYNYKTCLFSIDPTSGAGSLIHVFAYPVSAVGYHYILSGTSAGGELFFLYAQGDEQNNSPVQFWKSDGSSVGTSLVTNVNPDNTQPFSTAVINGSFYISDPRTGVLWRGNSNGTAPLIRGVAPGWVASGETLFSSNYDGGFGKELRKGNITLDAPAPPVPALTTAVRAVTANTEGSYPTYLTPGGGDLFFLNYPSDVASPEIWKSDGTTAGTQSIVSIEPLSSGAMTYEYPYISGMRYVNGTLFFQFHNPTTIYGSPTTYLWKRVGTTGGVSPAFPGLKNVGLPVDVGGTLYFAADDGSTGTELWASDGAGTRLVKDINPGSGGSYPYDLTNVAGTLYFLDQGQLWKSDGTSENTGLAFPALSYASIPLSNAGTLYFTAQDGNGTELWSSDTTGTHLVASIGPPTLGRASTYFTEAGGNLFFVKSNELWEANTAGAHVVTDPSVNLIPFYNNPYLTAVNGTLYFTADDGTHGQELWKCDSSGASMVADIAPGSGGSNPSELTNVNGVLFFTADDGVHGRQVWTTDGTSSGTVMVSGTAADPSQANPYDLVNVGGTLCFSSFDESHGRELWKVVANPATTTSVSPPPAAAVAGEAVTLTANVSAVASMAGVPQGTVTFEQTDPATGQVTTLGTCSLDTSGTAVLTTSALPVGSDQITATYSGDSTFIASTSPVFTETVSPDTSTTSVSADFSTSLATQFVTLTATVGANAPGSGTPTGTVVFQDGGSILGSASLTNGFAVFTTSALSVGSHSITAVYGGDSSFLTSTSSATTEQVNSLGLATLQSLVSSLPTVGNLSFAPLGTSDLDTELSAIGSLSVASGNTVNITIGLAPTSYQNTDSNGNTTPINVSAPAGTALRLTSTSGNATLHDLVTSGNVTIDGNVTVIGNSPALVVNSGSVTIASGVTLVTATDSPTILVNGGTLAVLNSTVEQASTTSTQPAILIAGGTVNLGTASQPGNNTIEVSGQGSLVQNDTSTAITAVGNTLTVQGTAAPSDVATLALSPPNPGQTALEGSSQSFNLGTLVDSGGGTHNWTIDVGWGDGRPHNTFSTTSGSLGSQAHAYLDNGSYTVTVTARLTLPSGATAWTLVQSFVVAVSNVPPAVAAISAPLNPTLINTAITASANFTDPGTLDTHTAVWNWGDGATSAGVVSETNGSGSVTGSHTYTTDGVFAVSLNVTDKDGGTGQSVFQYVVIYNPSAGYVTGGGWITSPAGSYPASPALTGKANFGFVSKYQKGATIPTGNTQFQFQLANLNFQSTSYQWLVVSGPQAQFKGSGTINGSGDDGFLLTAVDGELPGGGGSDKFRIKIWDNVSNTVIYDNQMSAADNATPTTAIGGGDIVIHASSNTLQVAGGATIGGINSAPLAPQVLAPLVDEAIAQWHAAGVDGAELDSLKSLMVRVDNLPGSVLGVADAGTIWIDQNAAGHGWYIGPTRGGKVKVARHLPRQARGSVDLLSVLVHEMGHELGLEHSSRGVMTETLPPGARRLPAPIAFTSLLRKVGAARRP